MGQTRFWNIQNVDKMITVEKSSKGAIIWLDRPDKRNAINREMINLITKSLTELDSDEKVRYVVIRGRGKVFSAGADIEWMKASASNDVKDNYFDALTLANFFHQIYRFPKPIISVAHGSAYGGAVGILAASDIALCTSDTTFALSEVKLGIIPATISPFVIKRMGEFMSKELMLTGRKFIGEEAEKYRLVNKCLAEKELDEYLENLVNEVTTSAPEAVKACKRLIHSVTKISSVEELINETSKIIADIRSTEEAKEGLSSFLEKRKPNWIDN